eukprot:3049420-Amphidinium_carterae.1
MLNSQLSCVLIRVVFLWVTIQLVIYLCPARAYGQLVIYMQKMPFLSVGVHSRLVIHLCPVRDLQHKGFLGRSKRSK